MKKIHIWKSDLKQSLAPHEPLKVEVLRRDRDARNYENIKPDKNWVAYELVKVKPTKKKKVKK